MFQGKNIIEFTERFKTDIDCLAYLSEIKWSENYVCPKCVYTKYCTRNDNLARECNRCHRINSPTANTFFHKLRFGLRKAFMIVFEMRASTKGLSALQVSKRYRISRTTAWTFMEQMHTIIHQLKSWLRSVYSWEDEAHIEKYMDEFSFRINRSIYKQSIFHKLFERMTAHNPTTYQAIKNST